MNIVAMQTFFCAEKELMVLHFLNTGQGYHTPSLPPLPVSLSICIINPEWRSLPFSYPLSLVSFSSQTTDAINVFPFVLLGGELYLTVRYPASHIYQQALWDQITWVGS